MPNRVNGLLCLLVTALMVAGAASVVVADGGEGGGRSGGDRATDIDGHHRDEFDNSMNLTVYSDAWVRNGALTLDRSVRIDEFDRVPIAPWQLVEGSARIVNEVLLTNATATEPATVGLAINLHDIEIFADVSPGIIQMGGPYMTLMGPDGNVSFRYSSMDNTLAIGLQEGPMFIPSTNTPVTLFSGDWYEARLAVLGDDITLSMGSALVATSISLQGNFTSLRLCSGIGDSAAWDNVTVNKVGAVGTAMTHSVDKPDDTYWDTLQVSTLKPVGTTVTVTLLDSATGAPLPGLEDITRTVTSLTDLIDPLAVTGVKLYVEMETATTAEPSILFWKVSWYGDQPRFIKPFPDKVLYEDEPQEDAIDLRTHFEDKLTDKDNLTFSLSYASNSDHVLPVVDGHMLGFELPTKDWYGTEQYKITCSDGTLSVESTMAEVEVKPLNDPPTVKPWDRLEVDENEELVFNMTPYLEDVDTPVEVLTVRTTAHHVTIEGQVLSVTYDKGGFLDKIPLEVSDRVNAVPATLEVTVYEIDDPPVFDPIEPLTIDEDDTVTIDLADYVSDEDTDMEWVTLALPDRDSHITADGLVITLLYPRQTGEFLYTLVVSDGTSTVSQIIEITVLEVNDRPKVVKVGDEVVDENGEVFVNVTEGYELELVLEIDDEDSQSFQFVPVSEFDGAYMSGRAIVFPTKVGDIGTYKISIIVNDLGETDKVVIHLEVLNKNDPPFDVAITAPTNLSTHKVGDHINFTAYALDPDLPYGEVLEYRWHSDVDGDLGTGKRLEVSTLSEGYHRITLTVDDGELSSDAWITLTMKPTSGGGGGGGGGGGDDDGGGAGMMIGIIVVIVLVAVIGGVLFMRSRGDAGGVTKVDVDMSLVDFEKATGSKTAEEAAKAAAKPLKLPPKEPEPEAPEEERVEPKPAPKPKPAPTSRTGIGETIRVGTKESFTLETPTMSEEEKALDDLKRKYHNAIGTLDFGIPSPELANRDWFDVAAALAAGETKTLDDGRKVTEIDGRWYYSDTDDKRTFLKEHRE